MTLLSMLFIRIKSLIKNHVLGIAVAILTGLIVVGPNIIFINSEYYRGLPLMYTDFETYYLTRLDAAYEGCTMSCNPYIKDHGAIFPFFDPSISTFLLALPGKILNIPTIPLKMAYDFLLPVILTLLSYGLIWRLTRDRQWSVLGSTLIILGFSLINSLDVVGIQNFIDLSRGYVEYPRFLLYSRPVNPQFSSIIFFIYIHIILSFLRNPSRKWFWLLTFIYALSFYIYFYTYTFLTVVNVLLVCIYLIRGDKFRAKLISYTLIIGIACAIPIINEIAQLVTHPYSAYLSQYEIFNTHRPSISLRGISFAILLITLILYQKKKGYKFNEVDGLFLALILSVFVVHNQHVLTGRVVQNFHYEWYFATPIMIISIIYTACTTFKWTPKKSFTYTLATLVIANAIFIQHSTYAQRLPQAIEDQKIMPMMDYLRTNISPKSVIAVATSSIAPDMITIFTRNFVTWAHSAEILYLHGPQQFHWEPFINQPAALKKEARDYGADYLLIDSNILKSPAWKSELDKESWIYNDGLLVLIEIN
jgi:hypothetical protein